MSQHRKLGVLIAAAPATSGFRHGLRLAEAALRQGVEVFLYCLDEAVTGLEDPLLKDLKDRGLKVFACAYGAQRRAIPMGGQATFSGLGTLSNLMANTDRFVSFH